MELKLKEDIYVTERKVPQGRRLAAIRGFVTRKGIVHDPFQANRAYNPTPLKLIKNKVKKEEPVKVSSKKFGGAADRQIKPSEYSNSLSSVHVNSTIDKLIKHPDYDAAKNKGDVEAAYRVVESLLKPEVVDNIRKSLNPNMPIYTVPVTKRGSSTGRLNVLPVVYATVLAEKLGGKTWTRVVKKSKNRSTNIGADDRTKNHQEFVGELPPKDSQSIIVDDCFTSGGSMAGLIDHLGKNGNMPVAATSLASSRYQNWLKPTAEKKAKLLEKGGITEDEFKKEFGYATDFLTGSEIQQYILTGSRGLDGLRRRFPSRTSTTSSGTNPENNKQGEIKLTKPKKIVKIPPLHYEEITNNLGSGSIEWGDSSLKDTWTRNGYNIKKDQAVVDDIEKRAMELDANQHPSQTLRIARMNAAKDSNGYYKKGQGFARTVFNRTFQIAKEMGINEFTVSLPSTDTRTILNHYIEKGIIKPIGWSGSSTDTHPTKFKILKYDTSGKNNKRLSILRNNTLRLIKIKKKLQSS